MTIAAPASAITMPATLRRVSRSPKNSAAPTSVAAGFSATSSDARPAGTVFRPHMKHRL